MRWPAPSPARAVFNQFSKFTAFACLGPEAKTSIRRARERLHTAPLHYHAPLAGQIFIFFIFNLLLRLGNPFACPHYAQWKRQKWGDETQLFSSSNYMVGTEASKLPFRMRRFDQLRHKKPTGRKPNSHRTFRMWERKEWTPAGGTAQYDAWVESRWDTEATPFGEPCTDSLSHSAAVITLFSMRSQRRESSHD